MSFVILQTASPSDTSTSPAPNSNSRLFSDSHIGTFTNAMIETPAIAIYMQAIIALELLQDGV
jgi:hypothetical protein